MKDTKTLATLALCLTMSACDDRDYVESYYIFSNQTDHEVRIDLTDRNKENEFSISPNSRQTIATAQGVRGIYMIDYLFRSITFYVDEQFVGTDHSGSSVGFYDVNNWTDYQEDNKHHKDKWVDTCTFVFTNRVLEDLK